MSAIVQAVHAEHALVGADLSRGFARAFTAGVAQAASAAFVPGLPDTPRGEAAQHAVERPQRADEAAVEPGPDEIEEHGGQEDAPYEPGSSIEAHGGSESLPRSVGQGKQDQVYRTIHQRDGVEKAGLERCSDHPVQGEEESEDSPKSQQRQERSRRLSRLRGDLVDRKERHPGRRRGHQPHAGGAAESRLQQTGDESARAGRQQEGEDVVLDRLAGVVAVHGRLLRYRPPASPDIPDEMVDGAERAHPSAEKSPQQDGRYHGR